MPKVLDQRGDTGHMAAWAGQGPAFVAAFVGEPGPLSSKAGLTGSVVLLYGRGWDLGDPVSKSHSMLLSLGRTVELPAEV